MLSRYNFNSWSVVLRFQDLLPAEARTELGDFAEEGKLVAWTSLQGSFDAADAAVCTLASGIAMRRNAWLQSSGFPPEVQHTIQDLPFDGQGLFAEQTDSRLHALTDTRNTIKSLGIHTPANQRKPFKPQATQQHPFPPRPRQDFSSQRNRYSRCRPSCPPYRQGQGRSKPPLGPKRPF